MDIQDYWDDNWANKYTEDGKLPSNFVVEVVKFIKALKIKNVLDLGAGKGRDTAYFASAGYEVTALDISESALEYIKEQNLCIQTVCANIADYTLPKKSYDLVFANLSLHYFDDTKTQDIFKKIEKSLTKNGLFCLACKSTDDFEYGKGVEIAENVFEYGHIRHFFSIEYTDKILQKCGFEVLMLEKHDITEPHYGKYSSIRAIARKI